MLRTLFNPAVRILIAMTLVTGLLYPMLITALAQSLFPHQANGSLVERQGTVIGSDLIGQAYGDAGHFWGRLSATTPESYNATASNASNFGPLNPALLDQVKGRLQALGEAGNASASPAPVDLVTASASGLDPDISVAAARYQVARVARARAVNESAVLALIEQHTQRPWLGILGEPRVNVLRLNLGLDTLR